MQRLEPPTPAPHYRQERSRRTTERIVASALELLSAKRIEEISVADIARGARISVGGFYARFESKDALFCHLDENVLEGIVDHARGLFSPEATRGLGAREVVARYVTMAVEGFRKHRAILRQVALRSRTSKDASFRARILALNIELHDMFRARLAERFDEIGHRDPPLAVDLALTAVSAAMREYVLFGDLRPQFAPVEDERLAEELTEMFRAYLRIEP